VRGHGNEQGQLFSYISPEQRVPEKHPLRQVKAFVDEILNGLSDVFDGMYSNIGRPSIPPERLLKSSILIALYTVRSDRLFCEMLDYNILFRWFLDMTMDEPSFDASSFSKNRDRLLEHDVAKSFFDAVVERARTEGLLSDEHFTVDGTLIEAWASLKSFKKKNEPGADNDQDDPPNNEGRNGSVDFHGEKRSNDTHESTTDSESRLLRKAKGKEAKLCFTGHALMENRNGLLVDFHMSKSVGTTEPQAAVEMLDRQAEKEVRPTTLGGDKNYHTKEFVDQLRARDARPHIAQRDDRKTPGLDRRTTRHEGYKVSQRKRKLVEEIFGWMKTVGGFRKTRFRGVERNQLVGYLIGAAYNLVRMVKLCAAPG
jgi:transposase